MRPLAAGRAPLIALISAMVLIAGCAVQGDPFEKASAPPDHAEIYLYRPYNFAGSLLHPPVICDDSVARIGPGGYQVFVVHPGKIICHTETETADEVEVDTRPGGVYYLKEEIGWGVSIGHPHLYPMDSDNAQTEIQQCCVLDKSALSTD
ncbi:MAG: hypothetical protein ACLQU2_11955 [Candidatus Binataceae bacterium]